jgi:hypothetical protein
VKRSNIVFVDFKKRKKKNFRAKLFSFDNIAILVFLAVFSLWVAGLLELFSILKK